MGLAASQARLLTITARKADCEFESMKLSHEKIALSRDMERISDEYQNAMNKTKLIYDYYGTGTSDMALTYGLLMTPSVYNDYYPKLLTDNVNRVVLNGPYATAAKAAGIPIEGYNGTPSSEVRNLFIESLRDSGVIAASTAASIESVSYNNAVGLGATFSATTATQDITYDDLLEMIKAYSIDTKDYGVVLGESLINSATPSYPDASLSADGGNGNNYWVDAYDIDGSGNSRSLSNKTEVGNKDSGSAAISLYDLLAGKKEYVLSGHGGRGPNTPLCEVAILQQIIVGTENSNSFLNWMVDQFSAVLGGVAENDLALQYAYDQVYQLVYPDEKIQDLATKWKNDGFTTKGRNDQSDYSCKNRDGNTNLLSIIGTFTQNSYQCNPSADVANDATDYIGFTYSSCKHTRGWFTSSKHVSSASIDLTTLAKVFMTAFVEYLEGIENSKYSYEARQSRNGRDGSTIYNLYEGKSSDIFKIKAATDVTDGTDNLVAGFYDALFNRICMSGWTENDNIENVEYMHELLKTGAVYISSIANDGCYYQSSYSTDTYISEVKDLEGVAQAEAKYNAAKAKIEHKENTIDLKMKNLDTEISSLTTEYDTMKGLISKTIEKSFKRYDA